MSTMDLCTSDHINEYIEAGVASLKIEGHMKRPEYVAAVTQVYSKAIKHYLRIHLTIQKRTSMI